MMHHRADSPRALAVVVSEDQHRPATFGTGLSQKIFRRVVHGSQKVRSTAEPSGQNVVIDGSSHRIQVVGKACHNRAVAMKGHHRHAVSGTQLSERAPRGRRHFLELRTHAAADVEEQYQIQWFHVLGKIEDVLRHAIVRDQKILFM
jgi:transposase